MYQYRTVFPLALSKVYLNTKEECAQHLKECVKITNEFLSSNNLKPLSKAKIIAGQRLLKLDFSENPYARKLVGDEQPITTEFLKKDMEAEERKKISSKKRKEKAALKCQKKKLEKMRLIVVETEQASSETKT